MKARRVVRAYTKYGYRVEQLLIALGFIIYLVLCLGAIVFSGVSHISQGGR